MHFSREFLGRDFLYEHADPALDKAELKVSGLVSGYATLDVVRGVSLDIAPGEVVLLTGHNGAGKSCLVETLFGLVPPSSGSVVWCGEDITGLSPRSLIKRGLALVPQGGGLVRNLTVLENLQLVAPGVVGDRSGASDGPDTLYAILERVPFLLERRNQIAGSLSGGQMRLLSIVRALITRPRLLIIDEPFLGLSGASGDLVLDLFDSMTSLANRFSVIVVEQQLFRLTGRIGRYYVMSQGQITRHGQGDELWSMGTEELWSLS